MSIWYHYRFEDKKKGPENEEQMDYTKIFLSDWVLHWTIKHRAFLMLFNKRKTCWWAYDIDNYYFFASLHFVI